MSTQTEPKLVTQIDFARAGQITPQMKEVAEREHRDPEYIRERVADGRIAIPANIVHIKKGTARLWCRRGPVHQGQRQPGHLGRQSRCRRGVEEGQDR